MSVPRALLVDLDGTLLDARGHRSAIMRTAADAACYLNGIAVHRVIEANDEAWSDFWPDAEPHWLVGELTGAQVVTEVWRRTLSGCENMDAGVLKQVVAAHLRNTSASYRLFEDARALLDVASGRLPLGLITNGASDTQREKLTALAIENRFEAVVISGEVGVAKPDPRIFHLALDLLVTDASEAWYVGDSLAHDVLGAESAGLRPIWLNRGAPGEFEQTVTSYRMVRSLAELIGELTG